MKKISICLLILVILGAILFIFKNQFLRAIGNALIYEDKVEKVDAIFVLGGDSYDRGREAIKLYNQNIAPKIVASGGNVSTSFRALGIDLKEAEVCAKLLIDSGNVPSENIIIIATATSTKEEAENFVNLCRQSNFKKIMIVSSKMHLGRVKRIFTKVFKGINTQILYHGTSFNSNFDEQNWWKSEEGLIFVNNEYVKSLYYLIKY